MIRRSLVAGTNWRLKPMREGCALELRYDSSSVTTDLTRHEALVLAAALVLNSRSDGESLDTVIELVRGSALHLEAKAKT